MSNDTFFPSNFSQPYYDAGICLTVYVWDFFLSTPPSIPLISYNQSAVGFDF